MAKAKVWRTGGGPERKGSVAVVIPSLYAELLEIKEGMKLECRVNLDRGEVTYRKMEIQNG